MRWGLMPPFYRTANGGPLLINARAEGIATKPAFREAIRTAAASSPPTASTNGRARRTPASPGPSARPPAASMAFAGLWQDWKGPDGWISTCAIVTCDANATLAPIHERMPVVVAPDDFALWLGESGPGAARLLQPAPDATLAATPTDPDTRATLARRNPPLRVMI